MNPLLMGLSLLNTAIVIFAGSWLALNGSLSQGAALAMVVVFVNYAQQYYQPIVQLTSLFNMIQLAITGARRITEVREQPDEVDPQNGRTLDGLKHELLIDNVHFSYIPVKETGTGHDQSRKRRDGGVSRSDWAVENDGYEFVESILRCGFWRDYF